MQTEQIIQPIINGSVNPRLTQDLFEELEYSTKKQVVWSNIVAMEFSHSFIEVDHKFFEKPSESRKFDDITEDNVNELFAITNEEFRVHHNKMMVKTANAHFELGKKIHEAQKELGFGGIIELDINRMQGYIQAGGSWNDLVASDVVSALGKMHNLAPRKEYGVNNLNTGALQHKLKSVHSTEYVIMEFDFISIEDLFRVKEFFNTNWLPVGRSIKADSIRFEEVDHKNGYYGIELIWWWD